MNIRMATHSMPGQAALDAVKQLERSHRKPLLKSIFSAIGRAFMKLIPDDETARKMGEKAVRQQRYF